MKIKIIVEETVKFQHDITVEVTDNTDIDMLLDDIQENSSLDEVVYAFEKQGYKVLSVCQDESGCNSELEITDYTDIEDKESTRGTTTSRVEG